MISAPNIARTQIGIGQVWHRRLRPVVHEFRYPTFFVMLPMRGGAWAAIARNRRFAALSFHDRDHGDGGADALAWAERLLRSEGVHDADGQIWLQTYPRVFGRVFKPVSFWFCERADGSLAAVLAEVNNTFGERHVYVLDASGSGPMQAAKALHVSPFCDTRGSYRFGFVRQADQFVARVDHDDGDGPLLQTSLSARLQPLGRASAAAALLRMPLLGVGVIARIHWQALRLWLKGVPWWHKPAAPERLTTRST